MSKVSKYLKNLIGLIKESDLGSKAVSTRACEEVMSNFQWNTLSSFLPYQAIDENKIFINRESLGFVIETLPFLGSDDILQKELMSIFNDIMDEESSIQFLLLADHRTKGFVDRWKAAHSTKGNVYEMLARKRAEFFDSVRNSSPKHSCRMFRCIISYTMPINTATLKADKKKLKTKRQKIIKLLSNFSHVFIWDENNLLQTLDGLVNFDFSTEIKQRQYNPYETLASQIPTGGAISVKENQLEIKNSKTALFRTYRCTKFPEKWSFGNMQNLIGDMFRSTYNVQETFFLLYGVYCPKQIKTENTLKRQMLLVEQQGRVSVLLRMVPQLRKELGEYVVLRGRLNEKDRIVYTQMGAGLWANEKEFEQADQSIKSLFSINGFNLSDNRYIHLPFFLSALPMGWGEYSDNLKHLNVLKTTSSTECSNLLPLQGEWWGTSTPGMLLTGRRGQIFSWHPFDNKSGNYNVVVTGKSGSGKSVFMQELLMSSLGLGANVFILDVGRSFEKMCSFLNGQFIEFNHSSNLCLNPFTYISCEDKESRETSFSMLKSVLATMAAPLAGTTDYENALLEQAIKGAWKKKKNKSTITDVAKWLLAHKDSRAHTLGTMLQPYTVEGVYSDYFEGENNINFSNPVVLIELEELKEKKDFQQVVLQLFIISITNRIFLGDRKTAFHICIDEAWDLLRGKQTGTFIETLARRLRKYNGS